MEDDEEPELWVLGGDDVGDVDPPLTAGRDADGPPLTSTLTSDDVAGDDWIDTSWLDELAPAPGTDRSPTTAGPTASASGPGAASTPSGQGVPPAVGPTAGPPPGRSASPPAATAAPGGPAGAPPGPPAGPPPSMPPPPGVPPSPAGGPPVAAGHPRPGPSGATAADEFAGLVEPISSDEVTAPGGTDAGPVHEPDATPDAAPAPAPRSRRRTAARSDEVSEFLRELSRLALDDD